MFLAGQRTPTSWSPNTLRERAFAGGVSLCDCAARDNTLRRVPDNTLRRRRAFRSALQQKLDAHASVIFTAGSEKLNPVPCFAVAQARLSPTTSAQCLAALPHLPPRAAAAGAPRPRLGLRRRRRAHLTISFFDVCCLPSAVIATQHCCVVVVIAPVYSRSRASDVRSFSGAGPPSRHVVRGMVHSVEAPIFTARTRTSRALVRRRQRSP